MADVPHLCYEATQDQDSRSDFVSRGVFHSNEELVARSRLSKSGANLYYSCLCQLIGQLCREYGRRHQVRDLVLPDFRSGETRIVELSEGTPERGPVELNLALAANSQCVILHRR